MSGCTITPGPAGLNETGLYFPHNRTMLYKFTGPQFQNYSELDKNPWCNRTGICMYFACKNVTTGTLFGLTMPWSETSLVSGDCDIIVVENATEDNNLELTLDDYHIMPLGLGTGSGVSDAVAVGKYNNCSVSMVVKYSYLDEETGRLVPEPMPELAECLLDKQIVPIYVWFIGNWSKLDAADLSEENAYLTNISKKLGEKGPVIIIPYAGANVSMNETLKSVARQIKQNCESCMVGVFLDTSINNTEQELFLNATLRSSVPSACPQWINNSEIPWGYNTTCIDFITWGINFNDMEDCNGYLAAARALTLGKRILHFYNRPSIILYYGGEEGQNRDSSCEWHDYDIKRAYMEIYNKAGFLPVSGIVYLNGPLAVESESYSINPYVRSMTAILKEDDIDGIMFTDDDPLTPEDESGFNSTGIILPFTYLMHIVTGIENIRPTASMSWNGVGVECSGGVHFGSLKFSEDDLVHAYITQILSYILVSSPTNFDCAACYRCGMIGDNIFFKIDENDYIKNYRNSYDDGFTADNCNIPYRSISIADAYEIDPYLFDSILLACDEPGSSCKDMEDYERAQEAVKGLTYLIYKIGDDYNGYFGSPTPEDNKINGVYDFAVVYSAQFGSDKFKALLDGFAVTGSGCQDYIHWYFFNEECQDNYFDGEKDEVNKAFAYYWLYFEGTGTSSATGCPWFSDYCK